MKVPNTEQLGESDRLRILKEAEEALAGMTEEDRTEWWETFNAQFLKTASCEQQSVTALGDHEKRLATPEGEIDRMIWDRIDEQMNEANSSPKGFGRRKYHVSMGRILGQYVDNPYVCPRSRIPPPPKGVD